MRKFPLLLASSGVLLVMATSTAFATDIPILGPQVEAVPRSIITPSEHNYSLMTLILGAQAGLDYNSNIYRAASGEESDFIATFSPKLNLKSNFEKHRLDFSITPEAGNYFADSKNNYLDWDARARGRFDASPTDALFLDARYRYGHVAIGSFEDDPTANLKDPVTFDRYELDAQWVGHKDFFHYEAGAAWDAQDYDNVRRVDNTLNVQDDRDRDIYTLTGKLGYEFSSPYIVYLRGALNDRRYDNRIDSSILYPRDSDGYEAAIGFSRIPGDSFLNFDAYIGYLGQEYDAAQLKDVHGIDAKATLNLLLSPADILEFSLDREVKDTNTAGVSSSLQTRISGEFTHNYSDTLSVAALLSYTASDYQTNRAIATLDREDDTYQAGINMLYSPRTDIDVKAGYTFNTRDSNQTFTDYDAHILGLSLGIKY